MQHCGTVPLLVLTKFVEVGIRGYKEELTIIVRSVDVEFRASVDRGNGRDVADAV